MYRPVAFLILVFLFLAPLSAGEKPFRWRAVWHVSEALLAGANGADIASSWGKNEANPLLRAGQRFQYGSLALKLGVVTGSLAAQHYLVRRSPHQASYYASANLAATAVLSAVAVHNMGVAR